MNRPILTDITLTVGTRGGGPLRLPLTSFTVFVGPNNAGKSLVLRELERYFLREEAPPRHLVSSVTATVPTPQEALDFIGERAFEVNQQEQVFGRFDLDGNLATIFAHNAETPLQMSQHAGTDRILINQLAGSSFVRLDGRARLSLADPKPVGDLQKKPVSYLHSLFVDEARRAAFRQLIHEAFGLYPAIDPTHIGSLRLRMSQREPADSAEERNWDERAVRFHGAATLMNDMSDGVKAYTGIALTLLGQRHRVLLIDEPEAFLHPPLARRLGRMIADQAPSRHMNVLASTHSAEFLFGAMQTAVDPQVVRLTYSTASGATARVMPPDLLRAWMRDPMLRSTGVLSALFHRAVVICEGDSDRPFYQEVNDRLNRDSRGAEDVLFLSGYGKQNIKRMLGPLRQVGIAAAAVVDLDILKGTELTDLLRAAQVPDGVIAGVGAVKGRLMEAFRRIDNSYPAARAGIELLIQPDQDACRHLLRTCAEYGIFIVPAGGVESWLSQFAIPGHGFDWLTAIFDALGADPAAAAFVRPGAGDVWEFTENIAAWLRTAERAAA